MGQGRFRVRSLSWKSLSSFAQGFGGTSTEAGLVSLFQPYIPRKIMKKILAILAMLACFGVRAYAADTTYVASPIYESGDCSSCMTTDSEYYLMTGSMSGTTPQIPMAVVDMNNGTLVPALIVPAGPSMQYGYMGPSETSDTIWQYSVYQEPSNVDVGGFSVNVYPDNRFRIINHHFVPTRTSAMVSADSVRVLNPYGRTLPTNFASGVKEH
jgi:hypothetical protein